MVGVSGFEPEASWTRTKRDTKLRHTPIDQIIIMTIVSFVKGNLSNCPCASTAMLMRKLYGVIQWDTELFTGRQTTPNQLECASGDFGV